MCWLTRENLAQMTEVSVAGCLGYDVLVSLIFFFLYTLLFQLLVV